MRKNGEEKHPLFIDKEEIIIKNYLLKLTDFLLNVLSKMLNLLVNFNRIRGFKESRVQVIVKITINFNHWK